MDPTVSRVVSVGVSSGNWRLRMVGKAGQRTRITLFKSCPLSPYKVYRRWSDFPVNEDHSYLLERGYSMAEKAVPPISRPTA